MTVAGLHSRLDIYLTNNVLASLESDIITNILEIGRVYAQLFQAPASCHQLSSFLIRSLAGSRC